MTSQILVVEDDPDVRSLIVAGLTVMKYHAIETASGKEAVEIARTQRPDLIILDLMLPDMDGLAVAQTLRKDEDTRRIPIIINSARAGVANVVKGLDVGAVDYVTKPFEVMELMARVQAQLRTASERKDPPKVIVHEGILLDRTRRTVSCAGRRVDNFTEKEFAILYQLIYNSPQPLTRRQIFERIWEMPYNSESRNVDVHIRSIRMKLGPVLSRRLMSVKGEGYKFI
ncbi:MAG: response regulator transcription factor [Elusimicrobia bacterium]|nr:response regulator transcription factor [Elusimicrobiota bacterium]